MKHASLQAAVEIVRAHILNPDVGTSAFAKDAIQKIVDDEQPGDDTARALQASLDLCLDAVEEVRRQQGLQTSAKDQARDSSIAALKEDFDGKLAAAKIEFVKQPLIDTMFGLATEFVNSDWRPELRKEFEDKLSFLTSAYASTPGTKAISDGLLKLASFLTP